MFDKVLKSKEGEKTEIVAKRKQEKKQVLVGRIRPHKGHKLFEVNKSTLEFEEATFEEADTITFKEAKAGKKAHKKVVTKDGFFYIPALNRKNCEKKIKKLLVEQLKK